MQLRQPLNRRRARSRGMTLLEIMVVITIIGVVMGIVAVAVFPTLESSKVKATRLSMTKIQQQIKLYYLDHNRYPTSVDQLVPKYLDSAQDAWGRPFRFESVGKGVPVIISAGPDEADTSDDVRSDQADIND